MTETKKGLRTIGETGLALYDINGDTVTLMKRMENEELLRSRDFIIIGKCLKKIKIEESIEAEFAAGLTLGKTSYRA